MRTNNLFALINASAITTFFGLTSTAGILIDYDDGVIGGEHDAAVNNGGFESTGTGNLADADGWVGTVGAGVTAVRSDLPSPVGGNNAFIGFSGSGGVSAFGRDTGHLLALGDVFEAEYDWRDAFGFDPGESVDMVLYYTTDDTIGGTRTTLFTFNSGSEATDSTYETEVFGPTAALADAGAVGKKLFVSFEANADNNSFSRVDNIFLSVVPEPGSLALLGLGGLLISRRRR
ncbi:MAG: PEP-CTERM sorting domain-containing protein [Planctomycetota bacterium]